MAKKAGRVGGERNGAPVYCQVQAARPSGGVIGEATLKAGEELTFILQVVKPGQKPIACPTPAGAAALFHQTVEYWQQWLKLTGWYTVSNSWSHPPDPIPCGTQIFSRSTSHFQNRAGRYRRLGATGSATYWSSSCTGPLWDLGSALVSPMPGSCRFSERLLSLGGQYSAGWLSEPTGWFVRAQQRRSRLRIRAESTSE